MNLAEKLRWAPSMLLMAQPSKPSKSGGETAIGHHQHSHRILLVCIRRRVAGKLVDD